MSDPLKNLLPGDPLPTSIRTWNPILEGARRAQTGAGLPPHPPSSSPHRPDPPGPFLAQAPSGGIPKRTGITPGFATCTALMIATSDGTGYSAGDIVKLPKTFKAYNWDTTQAHGVDGDRVILVSSHRDGALLEGASCTNEEDPADIPEL